MVREFKLIRRPRTMVRVPGTGSDTTLPYTFLDLGRSSRLAAAVRVPKRAFYPRQPGGQTAKVVVQQPATPTPTVAATKRKIEPDSFQPQRHQEMQQRAPKQFLRPTQSTGQTTTVEQRAAGPTTNAAATMRKIEIDNHLQQQQQ